ncbi:hypothetical protein PM082_024789 [Marasmius tenuissimus]|nr:hypothetical protein PM082_022242 [Marasmius tenuissimus]KAJ8090867.1 hypothetical protein PM082_024789 [Marasmius tenuissimus]
MNEVLFPTGLLYSCSPVYHISSEPTTSPTYLCPPKVPSFTDASIRSLPSDSRAFVPLACTLGNLVLEVLPVSCFVYRLIAMCTPIFLASVKGGPKAHSLRLQDRTNK